MCTEAGSDGDDAGLGLRGTRSGESKCHKVLGREVVVQTRYRVSILLAQSAGAVKRSRLGSRSIAGLVRLGEHCKNGSVFWGGGKRLRREFGRGDDAVEGAERAVAYAFVVGEEEEFVRQNTSSQRTAKLVERGPGLGAQELVSSVVAAQAVHFEKRAVKLIGSALGDDVDVAGHAAGHRSRRNAFGGADLGDRFRIDGIDHIEIAIK